MQKRGIRKYTHTHSERFTVLRGRGEREVALGTERGEGQRRNPLTGHGYLEVAVSHIRKGVGGKKMKFHPSCYLETSKPEIANFQKGQHPSPAMGWKVICESLSGSLTFVFCLLKDKSNWRHCFTCTDLSHFALPLFCLCDCVQSELGWTSRFCPCFCRFALARE